MVFVIWNLIPQKAIVKEPLVSALNNTRLQGVLFVFLFLA